LEGFAVFRLITSVGRESLFAVASDPGSEGPDTIEGTELRDIVLALGGDDLVYGFGGDDVIVLGDGNDYAFGGDGRDIILGGLGDDWVYGEAGGDLIFLGEGQDRAEGGAGDDVIVTGAGYDWIEGGEGADRVIAGAGRDTINGGTGDDMLSGGADGDIYHFGLGNTPVDWGHDVISDNGSAATHDNQDVIDLRGLYGPRTGSTTEAYARVEFLRVGDDMVIVVDDGVASVTVTDMFGPNPDKTFIEQISFDGTYWAPPTFMVVDGAVTSLGDDRSHALYGPEINEVLFATDDDDLIYGSAGTNFIWTGDGADVLIYKFNDGENLGTLGGGVSNDIVQDFDVSQDMLDFTETTLSYDDLTISQDADGDAVISWYTPDVEISDIVIELRGVSADQVTEDLFLFA